MPKMPKHSKLNIEPLADHPCVYPSKRLSVQASIRPNVYPLYPSKRLSIQKFIRPSVYPSKRLSVQASIRPSAYPSKSSRSLSVQASIHPSVYPSKRLSVQASIRPSAHPSICPVQRYHNKGRNRSSGTSLCNFTKSSTRGGTFKNAKFFAGSLS